MTANNKVGRGLHFNMYHLIAALDAYVKNYDVLDTRLRRPHREKFCVEIIGFIERQMPANYAQACCSGLYLVLKNEGNFQRTFNLPSDDVFIPLDSNVNSRLGADFAVYSYYDVACEEIAVNWDEVFVDGGLANYVKQNQQALLSLECSLEQGENYQCSM